MSGSAADGSDERDALLGIVQRERHNVLVDVSDPPSVLRHGGLVGQLELEVLQCICLRALRRGGVAEKRTRLARDSRHERELVFVVQLHAWRRRAQRRRAMLRHGDE